MKRLFDGERQLGVTRTRISAAGLAVAALVVLSVNPAQADPSVPENPPAPQIGMACPPEMDGTMTLLPDGQTYAICEQRSGGYGWAEPPMPFEPSNAWLSYGPVISLHGQGMRNPNVTSGNWTATPLDNDTTCRAEEQTVIEAGVLSEPQVFQADQGKSMAVPLLPKLFYLNLSGHCLWSKN